MEELCTLVLWEVGDGNFCSAETKPSAAAADCFKILNGTVCI